MGRTNKLCCFEADGHGEDKEKKKRLGFCGMSLQSVRFKVVPVPVQLGTGDEGTVMGSTILSTSSSIQSVLAHGTA